MSLNLEMPAAKAPKKRSTFPIFSLILLLIIAGFGAWLYNGRIVSNQSELSAGYVPVISPMSSSIASIMVEPNAYVQAGQLLARLEAGDYLQQINAARALVQGAISPQSTAQRVAQAQQAAEEMVERIALARHEESNRRHLMEQRSMEHAKALLNMRDLEAKGANTAQKEAARKKEFIAAQSMQTAKAAFEHASQSRSAVEAELHKIRNSNGSTGTRLRAASVDPTLIHAPSNGYLTNNIPLAGQMVGIGDAVFQIIPESGAKLFAKAILPDTKGQGIANHTLSYVLPKEDWHVFKGNVTSFKNENGTTTVNINLENTAKATRYTANNKAKTVFWTHPLTSIKLLEPIFMYLSYLP